MDTPSKEPEHLEPPEIHRDASWGALLSIFVILAMIITGAFYAWGKRIAEERGLSAAAVQSVSPTQIPVATTSSTVSK